MFSLNLSIPITKQKYYSYYPLNSASISTKDQNNKSIRITYFTANSLIILRRRLILPRRKDLIEGYSPKMHLRPSLTLKVKLSRKEYSKIGRPSSKAKKSF